MTRSLQPAIDASRKAAQPDEIEIRPGKVNGRIRPPGSKSITNRAIVIAALASGQSRLIGALDSEDTRVMVEAWRQLGISIQHDPIASTIDLVGCDGKIPADRAELFLANSGTSIRFLTAAVALGHGTFRLDGIPRMRQRPIEGLLEPLRQLGAEARSELGTGCPPVEVRSNGLRGGKVKIAGGESSQFTSALLMAVPYSALSTTIEVDGELVSEPFVGMTARVMGDFGASVSTTSRSSFTVGNSSKYAGRHYSIEPDATAASYFWTAAAISGGEVTVDGLDRGSIQGDVGYLDILARMGAEVIYGNGSITLKSRRLRGVSADLSAISDTVPTLAIAAVFADGPTTIRGVAHIRHQETDRIHAIVTELRRIGVAADEYADGLTIHPGLAHGGVPIDTYNDHRIAMSFALVGLRIPGIVIKNPACTSKTYPGFFEDLGRLQQ